MPFIQRMDDSSEHVPDSSLNTEKYTTFSEISQVALKRQNEVIDFINNTDWELEDDDHTLHYIVPPSLHLVNAAWKEVQKTAHVRSR